MSLDLSTLPAPDVVEPLDFETILAEIKTDLLARYPECADVLALESEPLVKLMEAFAYRELLYRARVNDAARAHLLSFASGGDLDQLAALFDVIRQAGETDERLRERLRLRIAALAGQGTREYYEYHAMTAWREVRAARALQPQPGRVQVVLWMADDADAHAVCDLVQAHMDADDVHIVGVPVSVSVARARLIDVRARIWRTPAALPGLLEQLPARLDAQLTARAALGGVVTRARILAALLAEGVADVEFLADDAPPAVTALADDEYPALGVVELTDAGVLA